MKKQKYALNLLLILALTGFALWFALKDNYQQVVKCISQMNLLSLVIVLLWGVLFTAVWGFVYYVLGRKYTENYTPGKGMLVAFIGSFFSGITPSSTGGQFVQAYIMKKQGIKVSDGASLLWADFIIYQTTMMVYVSILFLLRFIVLNLRGSILSCWDILSMQLWLWRYIRLRYFQTYISSFRVF